MKNRESGFTLIEILVAIAIMSIMLVMIGGILQSTTKSNEKERIINEMDASLAKSVELIKRTARSAKTVGAKNAIVVTGGTVVTMNVPTEESDGTIVNTSVTFEYNSTDSAITARSGADTTGDVIASNVSDANFAFTQGVLTMMIEVNLNRAGENEAWKVREIRDAAVTRLDVE